MIKLCFDIYFSSGVKYGCWPFLTSDALIYPVGVTRISIHPLDDPNAYQSPFFGSEHIRVSLIADGPNFCMLIYFSPVNIFHASTIAAGTCPLPIAFSLFTRFFIPVATLGISPVSAGSVYHVLQSSFMGDRLVHFIGQFIKNSTQSGFNWPTVVFIASLSCSWLFIITVVSFRPVFPSGSGPPADDVGVG